MLWLLLLMMMMMMMTTTMMMTTITLMTVMTPRAEAQRPWAMHVQRAG
jgi:hypothetical protein